MLVMKDLISKDMLCTECKKIYSTSILDKKYLYFILFILLYSIASYFFEMDYFMKNAPYLLFIAFFIYAIGSLMIYFFYKDVKDCKVCNRKKTLIDLNTPEAKQIIKENNISVP